MNLSLIRGGFLTKSICLVMMFDDCSSVDVDQQYQASIVSNNPSSAWLHTPPAHMPWSIPVADQPSVMRFTGDSCTSARSLGLNNQASRSFLSKAVGKRKLLESNLDCIPSKQLITDEKMAANLSGLHISKNYTSHQFGSSVEANSEPMPAGESRTETHNNLPSLILCEELRRLKSEPIIPPSLFNKIERPTNALVLWQPPGGTLCEKLRMAVERSSSESLTQRKGLSSCTMEESEEDVDPRPSTSGLNQFTRATSRNQSIWADFVDNNNSNNTVDLNLTPPARSFLEGIPAVVASDDSMMDL